MMSMRVILHGVTRITQAMRPGQASIFPSTSIGRLLATITALPRYAFIEPTGTRVRTEQFRASAKSPKREQVGNSGFIEAPCSCPIRGHLRRKITSAPQIQAEHFNARILLTFRATAETVPKNCVAHSLNLSLVTTSTPPVVMTKSSTTNLSIASGLRAFQTAAQKSSTILTEFLEFVVFGLPNPHEATSHISIGKRYALPLVHAGLCGVTRPP
jgi:hypothetical protein